MGKRLYVGNLSYSLKSSDLEEVFSKIGEVVSAKVITDMETGRSKGFAFIEMATDDMAIAAIETLNGKEVDGRALKVTEASPRPERPAGGSRFGGNREGGFRGGNSGGGYRGGNSEGGYRGGNSEGGYRGGNSEGGYRGGNSDGGYRGGNSDGGYRGGNSDAGSRSGNRDSFFDTTSDSGFGGHDPFASGGRGGRDGGFKGGPKRKDRKYDDE